MAGLHSTSPVNSLVKTASIEPSPQIMKSSRLAITQFDMSVSSLAGPLGRRLCFDKCALMQTLDVVAASDDGMDSHLVTGYFEEALITVAMVIKSESRDFCDALLCQSGNDASVALLNDGGHVFGNELSEHLLVAPGNLLIPFFATGKLNEASAALKNVKVSKPAILVSSGQLIEALHCPLCLTLQHLGV